MNWFILGEGRKGFLDLVRNTGLSGAVGVVLGEQGPWLLPLVRVFIPIVGVDVVVITSVVVLAVIVVGALKV